MITVNVALAAISFLAGIFMGITPAWFRMFLK